jgi:CRISPR-associated protein (TIGR02584 family)
MKTAKPKTPKTLAQTSPGIAPDKKSPPGAATLIAVVGLSPAILTETIWALAKETPGLIPNEVVVVTTTRGKSDIERDLFTPLPQWGNRTVWQGLRHALLGFNADKDPRLEFKPYRIITANDPATGRARELDDISTLAGNAAAAEVILDEVRRLTANDDIRMIASLAGGRKTMGALLHAAVSLLGRRQDRLTHILVNDPFDQGGLRPKFFFPGQPGGDHKLRLPDGTDRTIRNADAVLQLADVPFAPLNYLFREYIGRLPGGFAELVRTASGLVQELAEPITIELDTEKWVVTFDGVPVHLTGRDIPLFCFLCQRARDGRQPYPSHKDASDDFVHFLADWMPSHLAVNLQFGGTDWRNPNQMPDFDHLRKRVASLRSRLVDAGLGRLIPTLFPIRGPLGFPPSKVRFASS